MGFDPGRRAAGAQRLGSVGDEGHRCRRQTRSRVCERGRDAMGEARSGQPDRTVALDAGRRGGDVRGAWHRRRRHQRRRPRRHPQRLRLVGAAREGDDRDVAVPSSGLRPSERPRRSRRRGNVRVRHQRRQAQRCRDVDPGARVRAGVVRAEARCEREDLVRAAHDFGRLRHRRTPAASPFPNRMARPAPI